LVYSCNPSQMGGIGWRIAVEGWLGEKKHKILLESPVAQVVECLTSKHKALSTKSNTTKKKVFAECVCEERERERERDCITCQ
jgi:hypothetical protein